MIRHTAGQFISTLDCIAGLIRWIRRTHYLNSIEGPHFSSGFAMPKLSRIQAILVGLIILAIHGCPSNAQISPVAVEEELKALNQSIAEGHIGPGIDRLSAFREQIDPEQRSRCLLDGQPTVARPVAST